MYRKFDEDADGILSFMETNKFMVATGNKPFNENQWQAVCKMAGGANPDSGLTVRSPSRPRSRLPLPHRPEPRVRRVQLEQFAQVETSAEEVSARPPRPRAAVRHRSSSNVAGRILPSCSLPPRSSR